eukprot:scaffold299492_cov19-Prasinocladus_malaysianus.AAC.1
MGLSSAAAMLHKQAVHGVRFNGMQRLPFVARERLSRTWNSESATAQAYGISHSAIVRDSAICFS